MASAGSVSLDVVWDASAARRDLNRKVKAMAEEAERNATVELKAKINENRMITDAKRAALKASKALGGIPVELNVRGDNLRAKVTAMAAAAGAGQKITVETDVDTDRAESGIRRLLATMRDAKLSAEGLRGGLDLLMFPGIAASVALLISSVQGLAGALVGLAAALSPALGLLGALPGFAAAAAQGIGSLLLGLSGIGGALKAMSQQQATSAIDARKAARTQGKSAAAQLNSAEALRKARQQLARSERDVIDRQKDARRAQLDLNEARVEARRMLADLNVELGRQALSEERASLNVEQARLRAREAIIAQWRARSEDMASAVLERKSAQLGVREAIQDLQDQRQKTKDLRAERTKATKAGVEGSEVVRQASERAADAQRALVQSTEAVVDAQHAVAAAMRGVGTTAAAAVAAPTARMDALTVAMDNLSPAGKRFARFLFSLKPLVDRLKATAQGGLLPGLEDGLRRMTGLMPIVQRAIGDTARTIGNLAIEAGKVTQTVVFREDLGRIMNQNTALIRRAGFTGLNFADALRHITIAAQPLVDWLSRVTLKWSEQISAATLAGRRSGLLTRFFERTRQVLTQLGQIVANVTVGLFNVGKAGDHLGRDTLRGIVNVTRAFRNWTASVQGRRSLDRFFAQAAEALRDLGPILVGVVRDFADMFRILGAGSRALAKFLNQHPVLRKMVTEMIALSAAISIILRLAVVLSAATQAFQVMQMAVNAAKVAYKGLMFVIDLVTKKQIIETAVSKAKAIADLFANRTTTALTLAIIRQKIALEALILREQLATTWTTLMGGAAATAGTKFKALIGILGRVAGALALVAGAKIAGDLNARVQEGFNQAKAAKLNQSQASKAALGIGPDGKRFQKDAPGDLQNLWGVLGTKRIADVDAATKAWTTHLGLLQGAVRTTTQVIADQRQQVTQLHDAVLDAIDAQTGYQQAQLAVKEAQQRVNQLIADGKQGSDEYRQAQIDLTFANTGLQRSGDAARRAMDAQTKAILAAKDATAGQVGKVIELYRKLGVKPPRELIEFFEVLKLRRDALTDKKFAVTAIARLVEEGVMKSDEAKAKHLIGLATGGSVARAVGEVRGPGTRTSDSIVARLSRKEFVQPADAHDYYGTRFMEAVRRKQIPRDVLPGFASGGAVDKGMRRYGKHASDYDKALAALNLIRRADAYRGQSADGQSFIGGKGLQAALSFAKAQVGKPYIWGGVGPAGYDCSGAMSALANVIMGRNPYHRLFATGSFPVPGWRKGFAPAGFNIGSFRGNPGHMAGTLGGVNVESSGGKGFHMGRGARGARDRLFKGNIWHLIKAGGVQGGQEKMPGFATGGAVSKLFPALGNGGVTPGRHPQLVMVGDSIHREVTAPEPMLREIVREESAPTGRVPLDNRIYLDGRVLFRAMTEAGLDEERR